MKNTIGRLKLYIDCLSMWSKHRLKKTAPKLIVEVKMEKEYGSKVKKPSISKTSPLLTFFASIISCLDSIFLPILLLLKRLKTKHEAPSKATCPCEDLELVHIPQWSKCGVN